MKKYRYDPILCMNVPDSTSKAKDADTLRKGQVYKNSNGVKVEIVSVESNYVLADFGGQKKDFTPVGLQKILSDNGYKKVRDAKDASWKAWTLYIDGKWVKSFNSSMAPIKEAQKFMKENYPGKVGKLSRNTGSSSGYSISGSEYKDEAPSEMRDAMVTDDIETVLKNFNKSSDFGDSVKVSLSNGKIAIVQKEYDGWYASVDGKRTKGSLPVIIGFLKSSSRDSASVFDKAIKICDLSDLTT